MGIGFDGFALEVRLLAGDSLLKKRANLRDAGVVVHTPHGHHAKAGLGQLFKQFLRYAVKHEKRLAFYFLRPPFSSRHITAIQPQRAA